MQKVYATPAELQTDLASAINGNQDLPKDNLVYDDVVIDPGMLRSIQDLNILVTQSHVRDRGIHASDVKGLVALFDGTSSSSKILVANLLAKQAGVEITMIDLTKVVSKYIGDTEKNFSRIFDAAEKSGNILFFDEADALFGKRSEVKDSHDRYANVELSYFIKLAENRTGLTIVSARGKNNLDDAFLRRLRMTISFPKN